MSVYVLQRSKHYAFLFDNPCLYRGYECWKLKPWWSRMNNLFVFCILHPRKTLIEVVCLLVFLCHIFIVCWFSNVIFNIYPLNPIIPPVTSPKKNRYHPWFHATKIHFNRLKEVGTMKFEAFILKLCYQDEQTLLKMVFSNPILIAIHYVHSTK